MRRLRGEFPRDIDGESDDETDSEHSRTDT
jgi:hypothetical protein